MAGLVPAIHVFVAAAKKFVDARHKAGHDESLARAVGIIYIERRAIIQTALESLPGSPLRESGGTQS